MRIYREMGVIKRAQNWGTNSPSKAADMFVSKIPWILVFLTLAAAYIPPLPNLAVVAPAQASAQTCPNGVEYVGPVSRGNRFEQAGLRGYCTWYAAERWLQAGNGQLPSTKDAGLWADDAKNKGLWVDKKTSVNGSLMVIRGSRNVPSGHVAYVESVDEKNRQFRVSEMNYGQIIPATNQKTVCFNRVSPRVLQIGQVSGLVGFIYPQVASEAKFRQVHEAIGRAYREILKREPDASGLRYYTALWQEGQLNEASLRTKLQNSPEYWRRFGTRQQQVTGVPSASGQSPASSFQLKDGEIVKGQTTPQIYQVQGGVLRPIKDPPREILGKVKTVSEETIRAYPKGPGIRLAAAGQTQQPPSQTGQSLTEPFKPLMEPVKPLIPSTKKDAPIITNLDRYSGAPGIRIKIHGKSLNPPGLVRPKVVFESVPRSVVDPLIVADSEIEALIPQGKGTVEVFVDTVAGHSNKVKFTYLPPRIRELKPQQGGTKQAVTLVGENFGIKQPLDKFYVKFGKSVVAGTGIVSWDDRQIVVNTPSDFGSGANDDMLLGAIGCLARAGVGGLTAVQDFVFDLAIPGCDSFFQSFVKKYQLKVNPSGAEGPVPVTVTTSAGSSNESVYTYKIGTVRGPAPVTTQPPGLVNPHVIVNPYSGQRGTSFNQPGQGFTPNSTVTLYFRKPDGSQYPPVKKTTDTQGRYSNAWTAPAKALPGTYQHWAVDDRTGRQSNVATFTLTAPTAVLGPKPTQASPYPQSSGPTPPTPLPQPATKGPSKGTIAYPKPVPTQTYPVPAPSQPIYPPSLGPQPVSPGATKTPGPFQLTVTSQCVSGTPEIHLSWTAPSGATRYDVYRNGQFLYNVLTSQTFRNQLVTSGTMYNYFVRANTLGGTQTSNTVTVTAPTCVASTKPAKTQTPLPTPPAQRR